MKDHYRTDWVTERLVRLIRRLGPGARLPSERDLAEALGISRTALRDRLQLMEGLGVLHRITGSGTFVREPDPTALALILDLALASSSLSQDSLRGIRIALERQAAIEAARKGDPVLLARMTAAARLIELCPEADESDEDAQADQGFHDALLRASGNPALIFFTGALASVLHEDLKERRKRIRRAAGDREVIVRAHFDIVLAVSSGDERAAAESVDRHFALYDELVGEDRPPPS